MPRLRALAFEARRTTEGWWSTVGWLHGDRRAIKFHGLASALKSLDVAIAVMAPERRGIPLRVVVDRWPVLRAWANHREEAERRRGREWGEAHSDASPITLVDGVPSLGGHPLVLPAHWPRTAPNGGTDDGDAKS